MRKCKYIRNADLPPAVLQCKKGKYLKILAPSFRTCTHNPLWRKGQLPLFALFALFALSALTPKTAGGTGAKARMQNRPGGSWQKNNPPWSAVVRASPALTRLHNIEFVGFTPIQPNPHRSLWLLHLWAIVLILHLRQLRPNGDACIYWSYGASAQNIHFA